MNFKKKLLLGISFILVSSNIMAFEANNEIKNKYAKDPIYLIQTNKGDIKVRILKNEAPYAARNFIEHSKNHYYDNNKFFRIIKKFLIQTGDPSNTGTGGKSIWNKPFKREYSGLSFDRPGILAYSGKNKNKSQFFITTSAIPSFNKKYTAFGYVIDGMNVVNRIANTRVTSKYKPLEEVKILTIKKENNNHVFSVRNQLQKAGRGNLDNIPDKDKIMEDPSEDDQETYFQKMAEEEKVITIRNKTLKQVKEEDIVDFGIK